MSKGLSVIVRTEQEYNHIQDFLGKEVLYIDWQPQMSTTETGVIIFSTHSDYSVGSVGDVSYHKQDGLKAVEFNDYFKLT